MDNPMPCWGIRAQEILGNIWENRYKYWVVETDHIQEQLVSFLTETCKGLSE